MGIDELGYVEQQQLEARWGRRIDKPVYPVEYSQPEWIQSNTPKLPYKFNDNQPCAMEAAVAQKIALGEKPPFVLHLVCMCPKCSPRC